MRKATSLVPVILAGGSGTRLWPLSRTQYPKQFIKLANRQRSFFQECLLRLNALSENIICDPVVITNVLHQTLVIDQAEKINKKLGAVILEPFGRNTAPAATLVSLIYEQEDPVLLIMPSDHLIEDENIFHDAVYRGIELAENGYLVTFGVHPLRPETGYGYIQIGTSIEGEQANKMAYRVSRFMEKPQRELAEQFVQSGEYFWNSGIFMMKASVWLKAMAAFRTDIADQCRETILNSISTNNIIRLDELHFSKCGNESIDYAVMEPASHSQNFNIAVVPFHSKWSDVGGWLSLWEISDRDEHGNVACGDVVAMNAKNNLFLSQHRLIAGIGVENLVVVETQDAILVSSKEKASEVKKLIESFEKKNRTEHVAHKREFFYWGHRELIDKDPSYQIYRYFIKEGAYIDQWKYEYGHSNIMVLSGKVKIECSVTRKDWMSAQETFMAEENIFYCIRNIGNIELQLLICSIERQQQLNEHGLVFEAEACEVI